MTSAITGSTASAVARSVRDLVGRGQLGPGDSLPPIRTLAAELGINRNTVATAYGQLVAAGIARTGRRAGTVIASLPATDDELDAVPGTIDLAGGNPDVRFLPDLPAAVVAAAVTPTLYGAPAVHPALREASQVLVDDSVGGELVVTHGAVDAVERVLSTYLIRGDTVALENPCFLASIGTVRLGGYCTAAIPLDENGMTPEGLERALRGGARAVIITPRAHNPTGVSVTAARAAELRAILTHYPEVLVIEDDHFSLASAMPYYRSTPPTTRRWILIRSVAKFLGPDLRLALAHADAETAAAIHARLQCGKTWVSHLLQAAAAHLLTDPDAVSQVEIACATYQQRLRTLTAELNNYAIVPFGTPDGLNLWLDLPTAIKLELLCADLAHAGWAVQPGHLYTVDGVEARHGIRITTATLEQPGTQLFADALAEVLATYSTRF